MAEPSPWRVLGITPTTDRGEIRRAYAARLKVTNPEDDADGFQALRTAYDHALRVARRSAASVAEGGAQPGAEPHDARPDPPPEAGPEHPRAEATPGSRPPEPERRWRPAPTPAPPPDASPPSGDAERLNRYCEHLQTLLESPWAAGPPEELTRAIYAVLDPQGLSDVATHLRIETWLAGLIVRTWPRSAEILDRAAATFGWTETTSYVADAAVMAVINRLALRRVERLFAHLQALLTGPATPSGGDLMLALDPLTEPRALRDALGGPDLQVALARLLLQTRPRSEDLLQIVARRLQWEGLARSGKADPAITEVVRAVLARRSGAVPRRRAQHITTMDYIRLGGVVALVSVLVLAVIIAAVTAPSRAPSPQGEAGPPPNSIASEIRADRDGQHVIALGDGSDQGAAFEHHSAAPTVAIRNGQVEVWMASTESADSHIVCTAAQDTLQGCRVMVSTMSDKGDGALAFLRTLVFQPDAHLADGPVRVHVHWEDVTTELRATF